MAVVVSLLLLAELRPEAELSPTQLAAYATPAPATQPSWDRRDESGSQISLLLQRAARLHQEGELERAIADYKRLLKSDPSHAEAYASLSKCLADQGKHDLADKAMVRATRLNHAALAKWSLF